MIILRPGEPVVGPNQQARGKAAKERREEILEIRPDFRAVAFRKIRAKSRSRLKQWKCLDLTRSRPLEPLVGLILDPTFMPNSIFPLDPMEWQRIQELVSKRDPWQRVFPKFLKLADKNDLRFKIFKRLTLSRLQTCKRLGNDVFKGGESVRGELENRREDVAGQRAVMRTGLDDSPCLGPSEALPLSQKSPRQQLAKQRPNADACEKIAAAPNLARLPSVVAQIRVIKRASHEIDEWQRAITHDPLA